MKYIQVRLHVGIVIMKWIESFVFNRDKNNFD